MNGQDRSSQRTDPAANTRALPEIPPVNARAEGKPSTEQQLTDVEERMSGFERSTLWLASIGLLVTVLTGAFIALQWNEMHSGATDTHTLAESAKSTAETAKQQVEASSAQTKALQDQVDAIKRQMRQDQRAWLEIDFGQMVWKENETLSVQMTLTNKGKIPAKNLKGYAFVEKIPLGSRPHFGQGLAHFGTGILVPNLPVKGWGFRSGIRDPIDSTKETPVIMSKDDMAQLASGRALSVVHGVVNYTDEFAIPHWTRFCRYYAAPAAIASTEMQKTVESCTYYNDTDNN